ncbi:MAG: hypothetical protein HY879_00535 [Deltaproteobacteria bacterium]|nr:hypothetical protein [Deltaproteobacteria bacterium]
MAQLQISKDPSISNPHVHLAPRGVKNDRITGISNWNLLDQKVIQNKKGEEFMARPLQFLQLQQHSDS